MTTREATGQLSRLREAGLRIRALASRVVVGMAWRRSELRLLPLSLSPIRSAPHRESRR